MALLFSVFITSLLGSLHCVGMCGGILYSISNDSFSQFLYHIGRLLGYLGLAFLLGQFGKFFLSSDISILLSVISAFIIGCTLIWIGVKTFFGTSVHLPLPNLFQKFAKLKNNISGSFLIGLLTVFIPCGWLHSFLVASISLASPSKSLLVALFFWLGTIPALAFGKKIIQKYLKNMNKNISIFVSICLITSGIYTIYLKLNAKNLHCIVNKNQICHY